MGTLSEGDRNMDEPIVISATIDIKALLEAIESSSDLETDHEFFEALAQVQHVKRQLAQASDALASVEAQAKAGINAKAKALYGNDWSAVAGDNFKITRSPTGDMFTITGKPQKKFTKVKTSVDSKAVQTFMLEHDGKLPSGIEVNQERGESLRITVNENY